MAQLKSLLGVDVNADANDGAEGGASSGRSAPLASGSARSIGTVPARYSRVRKTPIDLSAVIEGLRGSLAYRGTTPLEVVYEGLARKWAPNPEAFASARRDVKRNVPPLETQRVQRLLAAYAEPPAFAARALDPVLDAWWLTTSHVRDMAMVAAGVVSPRVLIEALLELLVPARRVAWSGTRYLQRWIDGEIDNEEMRVASNWPFDALDPDRWGWEGWTAEAALESPELLLAELARVLAGARRRSPEPWFGVRGAPVRARQLALTAETTWSVSWIRFRDGLRDAGPVPGTFDSLVPDAIRSVIPAISMLEAAV